MPVIEIGADTSKHVASIRLTRRARSDAPYLGEKG